jgi:hypothetical protein
VCVQIGDKDKRSFKVISHTPESVDTWRSGQKSWMHWRWQCFKFIKQNFIEWPAKSVKQSYWAGLYYEQQRSKGKSHQSAVRALTYK